MIPKFDINLRRLRQWRFLYLKLILFLLFIILISNFRIFTLYSSMDCACEKQGEPKSNENISLAVIVPFRDRMNELLDFVPHLNSFLNRQGISHKFYIINQKDDFRFNRGLLINVGFLLSYKYCDYFVMHDVDLLPLNDQLSYRYPTKGPFHLSAPQLHPKYHYNKYVGGILVMQKQHFIKVNGFSNNYWGWGLEDDEFYARIKESKLVIHRPQNLSSNSSNSFLHIHDKSRKRDSVKLYNQNEVTRKRDRRTGLDTTRYQLLRKNDLTIGGIPFTLFDVALSCNQAVTPWCKRAQPHKSDTSNPV